VIYIYDVIDTVKKQFIIDENAAVIKGASMKQVSLSSKTATTRVVNSAFRRRCVQWLDNKGKSFKYSMKLGMRTGWGSRRTFPLISPASRSEAQGATTERTNQAVILENLLGWLIANGAKGVDPRDNSKISLFIADDGSRGILATQSIKKGEILFQIPMRLGILDDDPGSDDSKSNLDESLPWSARLACKILSMNAQKECPWSAYIQSLPASVYSPTSPDAEYSDIQAIGYPEARKQVDFSNWVASSSWEMCRSEVPEGTAYEDFAHALTVVHSRTFSIPAKGRRGGVVRILMPLVDMLNHSGDVDVNMSDATKPFQEIIASDAVRWDCIPRMNGEFILCVSAVRNIFEGEELTLSYGERANDEFFIYYGFVPPRNPHDTVALHDSLLAAAEWNLELLLDKNPKVTLEIINKVYQNIQLEVDDIEAKFSEKAKLHDANDLEPLDSMKVISERQRINLQSNGRIDERLALLLESIYDKMSEYIDGTVDQYIKMHVTFRSFEILSQMNRESMAHILDDLDHLACWEAINSDDDTILRHNFKEMKESYGPRILASAWWSKLHSEMQQGREIVREDDSFSLSEEMFSGYQVPEIISETEATLPRSSENEDRDIITIMYRLYKQLIIWDSLLLAE